MKKTIILGLVVTGLLGTKVEKGVALNQYEENNKIYTGLELENGDGYIVEGYFTDSVTLVTFFDKDILVK